MRVLLPAFAFAASMAQADCARDNISLSCQIENSTKHLTLCVENGVVTYTFGPKGAPELTLTEAVETVDHQPWPGIGRSIWEDTSLSNGDFTYEVWQSFDKLEQNEDLAGAGGVTVTQNGETLVSLSCDPLTTKLGFFAIGDAKAERGLCYEMQDDTWGNCE